MQEVEIMRNVLLQAIDKQEILVLAKYRFAAVKSQL